VAELLWVKPAIEFHPLSQLMSFKYLLCPCAKLWLPVWKTPFLRASQLGGGKHRKSRMAMQCPKCWDHVRSAWEQSHHTAEVIKEDFQSNFRSFGVYCPSTPGFFIRTSTPSNLYQSSPNDGKRIPCLKPQIQKSTESKSTMKPHRT